MACLSCNMLHDSHCLCQRVLWENQETLLAEEPNPFIESVQELADSSGHDSSCMPCLGEHCMVFPK